MRIVYLGDNGSVHNQKWIKALSDRDDIELHVISFSRGVKYPNVEYHSLKSYFGNKSDYLLNIFNVRKMIHSIKPDVLHAHYATSYGLLGALSGFHPLIITGWGADIFDSPSNPLLKRILKFSFSRADALTVLSKVTLRKIAELTGKKVELIPFGVDTNRFLPAAHAPGSLLRIGTIRTLSEKYGVEFLIWAFAQLCRKYSNIRLEIVGDGELKKYLKDLVSELDIVDRVIFYGYVNQQTEFEKYYSILSNLDIFVIPSILDSETFGVAAVEASACGIPVVGTRVGGLPEVIKDGETGLIVPPSDSSEIANALERLINDDALRKKMGEAGRKLAVEQYDWQESINKMVRLYNRVLIDQK